MTKFLHASIAPFEHEPRKLASLCELQPLGAPARFGTQIALIDVGVSRDLSDR